MDALSWRKLAKLIEEMPEDRKDDHVTLVTDTEEVFALKGLPEVTAEDDISAVLDIGHRYLHI